MSRTVISEFCVVEESDAVEEFRCLYETNSRMNNFSRTISVSGSVSYPFSGNVLVYVLALVVLYPCICPRQKVGLGNIHLTWSGGGGVGAMIFWETNCLSANLMEKNFLSLKALYALKTNV